MNSINSRLKRLETEVIDNSEFCRCYCEPLKYEVIPITIDEWKRRFDTGEERHERLPDFCEKCQKPIDKRFIETTFEQFQETQQRRINEVIERMASYEN
jgi:hypothetical protein